MAEPRTGAARVQRLLAALAFALIGVSALAVVAVLVLRAAGVPDGAFQSGGLLVLQLLPLPGLPTGLLLVIALFTLIVLRRHREQHAQRKRL